jgi:hypothetical protein
MFMTGCLTLGTDGRPLCQLRARPNISDTAVPEGVRALADKAVAQTREVYEAFDASLTTFERSFDAAGQGAAAFNRKIVDISPAAMSVLTSTWPRA